MGRRLRLKRQPSHHQTAVGLTTNDRIKSSGWGHRRDGGAKDGASHIHHLASHNDSRSAFDARHAPFVVAITYDTSRQHIQGYPLIIGLTTADDPSKSNVISKMLLGLFVLLESSFLTIEQ